MKVQNGLKASLRLAEEFNVPKFLIEPSLNDRHLRRSLIENPRFFWGRVKKTGDSCRYAHLPQSYVGNYLDEQGVAERTSLIEKLGMLATKNLPYTMGFGAMILGSVALLPALLLGEEDIFYTAMKVATLGTNLMIITEPHAGTSYNDMTNISDLNRSIIENCWDSKTRKRYPNVLESLI